MVKKVFTIKFSKKVETEEVEKEEANVIFLIIELSDKKCYAIKGKLSRMSLAYKNQMQNYN